MKQAAKLWFLLPFAFGSLRAFLGRMPVGAALKPALSLCLPPDTASGRMKLGARRVETGHVVPSLAHRLITTIVAPQGCLVHCEFPAMVERTIANPFDFPCGGIHLERRAFPATGAFEDGMFECAFVAFLAKVVCLPVETGQHGMMKATPVPKAAFITIPIQTGALSRAHRSVEVSKSKYQSIKVSKVIR